MKFIFCFTFLSVMHFSWGSFVKEKKDSFFEHKIKLKKDEEKRKMSFVIYKMKYHDHQKKKEIVLRERLENNKRNRLKEKKLNEDQKNWKIKKQKYLSNQELVRKNYIEHKKKKSP